MNKCKICNTEFEGNICPNCGNSILSNDKQMKKDKQANILAIISLALTGLSFFCLTLTIVISNLAPVLIVILATSAIASLILAIISIVNVKTKRALSICALVLSIVWIISILVIIVFFAITTILVEITCESCWEYVFVNNINN